jgi:hypothetical protein
MRGIAAGGGNTGRAGGGIGSMRGEAGIYSSGVGGDPVIGTAAGDPGEGGSGVLGDDDLTGGAGDSAGGEMTKGSLGSSSSPLRSSSSQRRFRVFFAGGGTVGEGFWAREVETHGGAGVASERQFSVLFGRKLSG